MILDKLVEKKDLLNYIEFRIKTVKSERKTKHEAISRGRINELNHLKAVIRHNALNERDDSLDHDVL